MERFEAAVRRRDVAALREALRALPADGWTEAHQWLSARLDQVVPGEPTPPLTEGEEKGREVIPERDLERDARLVEEMRRALADEERRRSA